jgi:hypothetical protein
MTTLLEPHRPIPALMLFDSTLRAAAVVPPMRLPDEAT